jgi:GntR family transcriptional regulator
MNRTIVDETVTFSLDTTGGVPVYRQIITQIEHAILSGRLRPGDKLPTIRSLAVSLKVNPNTIAKAYGELEIRGILNTQVGSGTYISDKKPEAPVDARGRKIRELTGKYLREMKELGLSKDEVLEALASEMTEGEGYGF